MPIVMYFSVGAMVYATLISPVLTHFGAMVGAMERWAS